MNELLEGGEQQTVEEVMQKEFDGIIVRREEARTFGVPLIDYRLFDEQTNAVAKWAELLRDWLSMPYVYDRFGDDSVARREWRRAQQQKFGDALFGNFYKRENARNKFRAAAASTPELAVGNLVYVLRDGTPDQQKLADQLEMTWKMPVVLSGDDEVPLDVMKSATEGMEDQVANVLGLLQNYAMSREEAHAAK